MTKTAKYTQKTPRSTTKTKQIEKRKKSECQKQKTEIDVEDITCPICLEVYVSPVEIRCNHRFCLECVEEHILANPNHSCPLCRTNFQAYIFSNCHEAQSLIDKFMQREQNKQIRGCYEKRVEKFNQYQSNRRVYNFRKGDMLDLYDGDSNEWIAVFITGFTRQRQRNSLIQASQANRYVRRNYSFPPTSRSIAPWKRFTSIVPQRPFNVIPYLMLRPGNALREEGGFRIDFINSMQEHRDQLNEIYLH